MNDIEAQIEFLEAIRDVSIEREAAYATRAQDRERWRDAKQAFGAQRSFWREVFAYSKAVNEIEMGAVTPTTVGASTTVQNPAEED